jgi:hypothetical protein
MMQITYSIRAEAATGAGAGGSSRGMTASSRGGGALRSWVPLFSSSHLSMSSERPAKGRFPRREIISSLWAKIKKRQAERVGDNKPRDNLLFQEKFGNLLNILTMLRQELRCPLMCITTKKKLSGLKTHIAIA